MKSLNKETIIIIVLLSVKSIAFALETDTHRYLNKYIASHQIKDFSLDSYLKDQLAFTQGAKEKFTSGSSKKEAVEWVEVGGEFEDKPPWTLLNPLTYRIPYARSANHLHNPLAGSLGEAGFTGVGDIPHLFSGKSAILWSQKAKGSQWPSGHYSWHDVRYYFWTALTSTDQSTRDTNFADTFRGLGQLMHLVQDMSVPEHCEERWAFVRKSSLPSYGGVSG